MKLDWNGYDPSAVSAIQTYRRQSIDNIAIVLRNLTTDIRFTASYPIIIATFVDKGGSHRAVPYVPLDGYTSVPLMFPQLAGTFSCRIESPSAAMWVLLKATEQKVAEMVYLRMTEEAALNPGGRTLGGVLGVAIDPPATTVSAKDVQVEVEVEVANGEVFNTDTNQNSQSYAQNTSDNEQQFIVGAQENHRLPDASTKAQSNNPLPESYVPQRKPLNISTGSMASLGAKAQSNSGRSRPIMLRKRFVDTRGGVADVYIGETASRLPRPKDATSELETSRNIPTSSGTPFSRTDENTDKARAWISFKNTRRKVVPHWPGSEASTTPEKQIIHLKEPSEKQQMNVDSRVAKERLLADGGIPSPGTDEVETQLDRWLSSQFDVSEFPNITRLPSPKPNPPDQSSSSSHGSSEFGFSNINTPLSSSLNHPKSSSSDGHFGFSIDSSDTTSHSRGPILDRESASHGRIPLPGRNYESFNIVGRVGDMNRDQLVEEIRAVVHDAMQEFTMALNSASKEAYQD